MSCFRSFIYGACGVLSLSVNIVLAQTSAVKKTPVQKQVSRPASFDSTQTLEDQFTPANRLQFVGLHLCLPSFVNAERGPVFFSANATHLSLYKNRYYTVTDVLGAEAIKQIKQKKLTNICGSRFGDLSSVMWNDMIVHAVVILRENRHSDSLTGTPVYWIVCERKAAPYVNSGFNALIADPYFEKQKQLYLHQPVIDLKDKSKWTCTDVMISKNPADSSYGVWCTLANAAGEKHLAQPPSDKHGRTFMTEAEYTWLDHANRNEKEQQMQAEKAKHDAYLADCTKRFGAQYGPLVAEGKAEPGMNTAMCEAAWGKPWNWSKKGTVETWYYTWNYTLHFENNVLKTIGH